MASYGEGSLGKKGLSKLGITAGSSNYSEGSSTGVKSNPTLGEGYLNKETYNRLKNSKQFKQAYTSLGGEFTAEKFDEGISINNMDSAIDKLTKDSGGGETTKPKDDVLSGTMAESLARNEAYEDYRESGAENRGIVTGESTREEDYMNNYKLNLQKRLTPGTNTKVGSNPVSNIAKDVTGKGAGFGPV
tara:strand:- start:16 stop:582 length:567 start_codon:yes stop_codon:yes gene_type:complete